MDFYLLYLGCLLIFAGKAIADVVAIKSIWNNSIFSKYKEDSFFGAKTSTSLRKEKVGAWISSHLHIPLKIANYLSHTVLVGFTDVWHLANFVRRLGIYLSIFAAMNMQLPLYLNLVYLIIFVFLNMFGFWLMYNYILQKENTI